MIDDEQPQSIRRASAVRGPTLLVCEHSGDLARGLRRLLDAAPAVRIVETRSAAECLEALGRAPAALVAVELTAGNCAATLDLLATLDARFPHARTTVLAERSMREYRWLLHELGAVCVVCSPWQLATLVEMVTRQAAAPPGRKDTDLSPAQDTADEIWDSLPWRQTQGGLRPGNARER